MVLADVWPVDVATRPDPHVLPIRVNELGFRLKVRAVTAEIPVAARTRQYSSRHGRRERPISVVFGRVYGRIAGFERRRGQNNPLNSVKFRGLNAPRPRLELGTCRLTAGCSAN
jgi:hypothetical protein